MMDKILCPVCKGEIHPSDFPQEWRVSVRDFFAGCALVGITAGMLTDDGKPDISFGRCSEVAYRQADAMLKARGNDEV